MVDVVAATVPSADDFALEVSEKVDGQICPPSFTTAEAADKAGISVRTMENSISVSRKGSPELIDAVKRGDIDRLVTCSPKRVTCTMLEILYRTPAHSLGMPHVWMRVDGSKLSRLIVWHLCPPPHTVINQRLARVLRNDTRMDTVCLSD